ncbi:MAG: hypothetical protein AAFR61_30470 [Bacteroidota bacterium]
MNKNWLVKSYMKLPLLGKIILPFGVVFLVSAMFKLFKFALILGIAAAAIYALLKFGEKNNS